MRVGEKNRDEKAGVEAVAHGSSSRISLTSVTEFAPRTRSRLRAASHFPKILDSQRLRRRRARRESDDGLPVTGDRYDFPSQRLVDEARQLVFCLSEGINGHRGLVWLSLAICALARQHAREPLGLLPPPPLQRRSRGARDIRRAARGGSARPGDGSGGIGVEWFCKRRTGAANGHTRLPDNHVAVSSAIDAERDATPGHGRTTR